MSAYEESEIEASFDYCGNFMNVDKARAELAALRAAAAERDRLQAEFDVLKEHALDLQNDNFKLQVVVDARAAQLEQARTAIDRIVELGRDSHDVGDDVRWREMWHVAVEEVEVRHAANAPAPEAEPHFDSAQKYREALEQIEAVWVSESGTDEHAASLKMYTIAARALNNADDEKAYTAPEAEATK